MTTSALILMLSVTIVVTAFTVYFLQKIMKKKWKREICVDRYYVFSSISIYRIHCNSKF